MKSSTWAALAATGACLALPSFGYAVTLDNPGFESDFSGWTDIDPSAISSSDVHSGTKAAKITGSGGRVEQDVTLSANTDYTLSAWIYEDGTIGVDVGGSTYTDGGSYGSFTQVDVSFNSGSNTRATIFCASNGGTGRFDDFTLTEDSSGGGSLTQLSVSSADASSDDGNGPGNAIDGSLSTRWSAEGDGEWLRLQLSGSAFIEEVDIAWYKGDQRFADFDIQTSSNGSSWTTVYSGMSSGSTLALETYDVTDSTGSWVRVVGYGNSRNNWNSVTEIEVYGSSSGGVDTQPTITTTSLPNAAEGVSYSQTLQASSGDGNLTWNRSVGSLPSGVSLSSSGVLSGTASTTGTFSFTARVEDSDGDADTQAFSLTVDAAPSSGAIDFNSVSTTAYGSVGPQDGSGSVTVEDGGATLYLDGNRWRDIPYSYTVTSDTVIEVDFRSTDEGEMHAIGFDSDDNQDNQQRAFMLHGTQSWSNSYSTGSYSGSSFVTYEIHVGKYYTGSFDRLFFINDNDSGTGNSYFRNVRVYEDASASGGGGDLPSKVLDLTNWKITIPFDDNGNDGNTRKATEIKQPELNSYELPGYFEVNSAGDGVVFTAPVGGATTSGSGYPRSELREMKNNGADRADWSSGSGKHTMFIRQKVTHLPVEKPHIVVGQIHDGSDDVIVFRLEDEKLFIDINGNDGPTLDSDYQLGTEFEVKFVVENNQTKCYYNGSLEYTLNQSYSGAYFKAGAYTQSACSGRKDVSGESCSAYGQVVIYDLWVTHE